MSSESTSDPNLHEGFKFYLYDPSLAAAVIFTVLFVVALARHGQILIRERTWSFIPFAVGCVFEAVGYGARASSALQTPDWTLMPYIIQSIFILLGPALFAASIYMVLGRLIIFLEAGHHSLIRVKWLTKLFLLGDILSFFAQGGGGGMLATAKDQSSLDLGNMVILVGLGIQVVFFTGFMIVAALFHVRIQSRPTLKSKSTAAPWQTLLLVLYLTSILILVRSVFRMVEYAQGHNGALISKEIYVYLLDALLMVLVAAIFAFRHPSEVFVHKSTSDALGHDPSTSSSFPMVAQGQYGRLG